MWSSESERQGLKAYCTIAYKMVNASFVILIVATFAAIASAVVIVFKIISGNFSIRHVVLLGIAMGLGIIGGVIHKVGWWLAKHKGFYYDYAEDRCSNRKTN